MKRLIDNFYAVAADLVTVPTRIYTSTYRGLRNADRWTPVGAAVGSAVMGTATLGLGAIVGATCGVGTLVVVGLPTAMITEPSEIARLAVVGTSLASGVVGGLTLVASEFMPDDGYPHTKAWQEQDAAGRYRPNRSSPEVS